MDANKLQVLRDISYEIRPVCGLCEHAEFPPASDWGTCGLHAYEHEKHSDSERQLSIHRYGGCPQFVLSSSAMASMHAFNEFRPKPH